MHTALFSLFDKISGMRTLRQDTTLTTPNYHAPQFRRSLLDGKTHGEVRERLNRSGFVIEVAALDFQAVGSNPTLSAIVLDLSSHRLNSCSPSYTHANVAFRQDETLYPRSARGIG